VEQKTFFCSGFVSEDRDGTTFSPFKCVLNMYLKRNLNLKLQSVLYVLLPTWQNLKAFRLLKIVDEMRKNERDILKG